jgi:hypothetical protein
MKKVFMALFAVGLLAGAWYLWLSPVEVEHPFLEYDFWVN